MSIGQILLAEVLQESANTRKLLVVIPFEKSDFKPHEKSMSLKRLATHVAEITGWWKECLLNDVLDFSVGDYKPKELNSVDDLLAMHDDLVAKATKILTEVADE